jgi:nifR3 family TIM-barrel protein
MNMKNFWQNLPKPILALAPMCGVTDLPFRLICKQHGADVVYSEMIMVQSLVRNNKNAFVLSEMSEQERPVIIQLGGNEPKMFFTAAKMVAELGADGIDINFGCPAKKIAGNGSGVALLRDLERSYQIVQATIEGAQGLPVSIKTRSRIKLADKANTHTSLDLLDKVKDLPVAAVMIHGRSYEAPWVENVDYDYIREVKETFNGIVLANGGIYDPQKAKEVLEITKADGLGIAHGVYGRPWIFQQIKDYLSKGSYDEPTWGEKQKIALQHLQLAYELKGQVGLNEFKKQLLWYVKGVPGAAAQRDKLAKLNTIEEFEQTLKTIKN